MLRRCASIAAILPARWSRVSTSDPWLPGFARTPPPRAQLTLCWKSVDEALRLSLVYLLVLEWLPAGSESSPIVVLSIWTLQAAGLLPCWPGLSKYYRK